MNNTNKILMIFTYIIVMSSVSGCVNYNGCVDADSQKMERDSSSIDDMEITIRETFYPKKNMNIKKIYRGPDKIIQETDIDRVKSRSYFINRKCVLIESDEDRDGFFEIFSIFDPDTNEFEIYNRGKDGSVHPMESKMLLEIRQKSQEAYQAMEYIIQKEIDGFRK